LRTILLLCGKFDTVFLAQCARHTCWRVATVSWSKSSILGLLSCSLQVVLYAFVVHRVSRAAAHACQSTPIEAASRITLSH
jgi:hypothetical protein